MQWTGTPMLGVYMVSIMILLYFLIHKLISLWCKGLDDPRKSGITRSPDLTARELEILERSLIMRDLSKIEQNTRR